MGLFSRKPKVQKRRTLTVAAQQTRREEVRGIPHYQDNIRPFVHRNVPDFRYQHELDVMLTLTPDPTIEFVENAVRVDLDGKRIGHVAKHSTPAVNDLLLRAWNEGGNHQLYILGEVEWELKAGPFDVWLYLPARADWSSVPLILR